MTSTKYTIAATSTAILFVINFFVVQSTVCATILFGLFLLLTGWITGHALLEKKDEPFTLPIGMFLVVLLFPIIITPLYWFFGYQSWYPAAAALFILLGCGVLQHRYTSSLLAIPKFQLNKSQIVIGLLAIVPLALLLFVLAGKIHGDTIISPWIYIGPRYWILAAITLIASIYATKKIVYIWFRYVVLSLWYTLILSVIFFMYKYAFGFDQHIHLASMNYIIDFGSISPKVPYYLGQYFLAIPLAELTGFSLDWMSRALVPIGAALLFPLYLIKKNTDSTPLFFLPLIPLSFFTFTTPNNLALLFALITILSVWRNWGRETKGTHIIASVYIFFALITHVFIGLPLAFVYISFYTKKLRFLSYAGIIFVLPVLLTFFAGAAFGFTLDPLVAIIQQPHWLVGQTDSTFWHMLYQYKAVIPYLFILISLVGAFKHRTQLFVRRNVASVISLLLLATLSSIFLTFPNLLAYEQGVYAQRLFQLVLVITIPLFLLGLQFFVQSKQKYWILPVLMVFFFASYYFTYPTRDPISLYTGISIRDADVEAVQFIETHADEVPYIVLTNQQVSAAAMDAFGMSRYIQIPDGSFEYLYSIPTGGPLYGYFREYIYEGYNRESIENALQFAGVERAYIIHTNYWAPAGEIRDASKAVADAWWELADGRVWVFEFNL